jgi:DNA polymerase elongation subunit (family B)
MKWEPRSNIRHEGDLIFQCLDWYSEDSCADLDSEYPDSKESREYKIFVFGVDSSGNSVSLRIDNYKPFFFFEVPYNWGSSNIYTIKEKMGNYQYEFLKRKRYYGFENGLIRKFVKVSFKTSKQMNILKNQISNGKFPFVKGLYESNIDPVLRFTHIRDILTAGWIIVKKYSVEDEYYTTDYTNISEYSEYNNKIADFRVLYFDIEACSEDGSFPNALKKHDKVTQVCAIIKDSKGTNKYLFNLGTIDPIESVIVLQFKTETELLLAYSQFINDTDPDVIVGYNIFGFDNGYMFERAQVLGITEEFNYQSKINKYTDLKKKVLDNQQSGFNEWKMTKFIGRIHIDLLQVIKKDFKLESYKLDYVGEHFLKEGKDDVSPKEIFEAWNPVQGSREKRTRVGKYCVQDTYLCLRLFEKFSVLTNHIEMAKVTRVPLEYLITRGQSIKVFSQIAYETRKAGFLIPVLPFSEKESKFQGATVLEAKVGYYQKPVAGLDFASLYPSIMIAHNMCYSTIVLDSQFDNIPGVEYSEIVISDSLTFKFVQNVPGVLSGILQNLWTARKVTKKEMNAATDPFLKSVFNAKQLAIKVSMNSIYGFTGAVVGVLPCLEISQSVTGCGRQMIEQTSNLARSKFNCEVIYGDSVLPDTPVLLRYNGGVLIKSISELYSLFKSSKYLDKEQSIPDYSLESWTSSGWKRVLRIIRHNTTKKIYRVNTPTGLVDVTEDHSLLTESLEQIKPCDVNEYTRLFHSYPEVNISNLLLIEKNIIKFYNNLKGRNITTTNKTLAAYYFLLSRFNKKPVFVTHSMNEITLNFNNNIPNNIITSLGNYSGYVYDIETEDGSFAAGVGDLVIKNTDSCYVIFPEPVDKDGTLTSLFSVAENAAKEISKTFKKPIELEFEKFMYPLILVAKKRYMYVEWTNSNNHNGEIEAKGVELVRRDNCPYVKETLDSVLQKIFFEKNLIGGRETAEYYIDSLLSGKVDICKLILSKNLRNEYKRPETIAHYQLVEKMKLRDPNSAPKPGDRVPFVYVQVDNPKALSWERVEDPKYVVENNVRIDYLYYLEHQLKVPLETIFDIILGDSKVLFNRKSFKELKGDLVRTQLKNRDIRNYFVK